MRTNSSSNGVSAGKPGKRPRERFTVRDSILTTALQDDNLQSTFALFKVLITCLSIGVGIQYMLDVRVLKSDITFLLSCFRPLHVSLILELVYMLVCLVLLFMVRWRMQSESCIAKLAYGSTVAVSMMIVLLLPIYFRISYNMSPVMSCAIVLQQFRMILKIVSFLVENSRIMQADADKHSVSYPTHSSTNSTVTDDLMLPVTVSDVLKQAAKQSATLPTITSMAYYLFAPTVIYQRSYPRSHAPTNWRLVAGYAWEWVYLFVPATLTASRILVPTVQQIGLRPMTPSDIMIMFLCMCTAAVLKLAGIGYFFLHCWSNMFAEIMRFGDRSFYRNYWPARTSVEFWSKWNTMIKAWIVEYAYLPCYRWSKSYTTAGLYVAIMSAIAHDYAYSFILGFLYPHTLF